MAGNNLIVDLSQYKDRSSARVDPGKYRVQVESVDVEESKGSATSGSPMIVVYMRILGGEFDGANLVDRLIVHDKTMFRVVGFMQAIGLPTPKKRLQVNVARFVGKVLDVDVEDGDPYQGRIKSEVRGYNRIPKSEQPVEEDLTDDAADDLPEPEETQADIDGADGIPSEEDAPATASPAKATRKKKAEPEPEADDTDDEIDLEKVDL